MAKEKFYVVWKGLQPGVYDNWSKCKLQVQGFEGAIYKSFPTRDMAEQAYKDAYVHYIGKNAASPSLGMLGGLHVPPPITASLAVDASCEGNPGILEYRGVYTHSKEVVFSMGPFPLGTVNIGEFLAIVHGLAILHKKGSSLPLYSDSMTAIAWVKRKKINSRLERTPATESLYSLVDRALLWLQSVPYANRIIKWDTEHWGEIPADYGRK